MRGFVSRGDNMTQRVPDAGLHRENSSSAAITQTLDSSSQTRNETADSSTIKEGTEQAHGPHWLEIGRIVFVGMAAAAAWLVGPNLSLALVLAGVACALIGGYPIFHEAVENIVERRMTMELSMAIAILAALAIREVFTALVITLFVLIAEVLEGLTVGRGRAAIRHLIDLLPSTVTVNEGGAWKDIGVQEVSVGTIVLIRPGSRISVDGLVVGGHSFVDQATITGESMPVEKNPGAQVYAGTINQSGALEVRAERLGRDTTFGKIIRAVEEAEQSRAPIQRVADRLAGYLVYFAMGAAVVTFLLTHNIRSTISVVIVAGACGIAAGTPLAILGGIGRAAHQGAIIKGGLYLEKLAEVDTILLDKTGTLTFGTPEVSNLHVARDGFEDYLLTTGDVGRNGFLPQTQAHEDVRRHVQRVRRIRRDFRVRAGGVEALRGKFRGVGGVDQVMGRAWIIRRLAAKRFEDGDGRFAIGLRVNLLLVG